jgi:CheY-like chemotaxis protein
MFRKMGFDVQTATSGTEAIKKCKDAFQQGQGIDLVVLDLTVAGGDGAKQCIGEIKKISGKIKAVVSSGYEKDPVMLNHREYGFQKAVKKPFRYEELYASVKELFS